MAYLDKILQPGERVLAIGRLHWIIFVPSLLILAAGAALAIVTYVSGMDAGQAGIAYGFAALIFVLGAILFMGRLIKRWTTEFAVTDHRVVVKRGVFALHTVEMNIDKVESVDVDQSLWGRMLGFGAVTVHGTGARWDPIFPVADPLAFRNAISSLGAAGAAPRAPAPVAQAAPDADLAFWDSMADKNDPDLLQEYLIRFPDGRFASLAKTKLARAPR